MALIWEKDEPAWMSESVTSRLVQSNFVLKLLKPGNENVGTELVLCHSTCGSPSRLKRTCCGMLLTIRAFFTIVRI